MHVARLIYTILCLEWFVTVIFANLKAFLSFYFLPSLVLYPWLIKVVCNSFISFHGMIFILIYCCSHSEMMQFCMCVPHPSFAENNVVVLAWWGRDYRKYSVSSTAADYSWHCVSLALPYILMCVGLGGSTGTLASSIISLKTFREHWLEACYNGILLLITPPVMSTSCGTCPWWRSKYRWHDVR
jgi:hypothetical protein